VKLIVGLGNPGAEYARSRHNVGWRIADAFAEKFRIDIGKHEKEALTGLGRVAGGAVMVAKPLTFMNRSGDAVKLLTDAYVDVLHDLIIVSDDVDLPLGKLRIRERGSSGTHNGMRSVVASLASESFPRLRCGVRGANYAEVGRLRDYVLDNFEKSELPIINRSLERAVDALVLFARGDLKRAMNEFNRDSESESENPETT